MCKNNRNSFWTIWEKVVFPFWRNSLEEVGKIIGHRITNLGQHSSHVLSARMITSSTSLHYTCLRLQWNKIHVKCRRNVRKKIYQHTFWIIFHEDEEKGKEPVKDGCSGMAVRMTLRIQRDCYTVRYNSINVLSGDAVCFMWGMNWDFK